MDKEKKEAKQEKKSAVEDFSWLPIRMPGVAALVKEKRQLWGNAWVNECWKQGVLLRQPGWFYAGEGAVSVGVVWDDPAIIAFAAARVTRSQALLVMRPPGVVSVAEGPAPDRHAESAA